MISLQPVDIHVKVCVARYKISQQQLITFHLPFQRGDRLYTSESDVYRRQIPTYTEGHRTERIEIFKMAVDP